MTPARPDDPGSLAERDPVPPVAAHLRDGTPVGLRSVRPGDGARVAEFLSHVSLDALERRFVMDVPRETVAAEIVTPHSPSERVSLILEVVGRPDAPIVAHGEYSRGSADPTRAEVAFLVADEWQGRGAATLLLLRLAHLAARAGVQQLEAVVLEENQPMLDVFLGSGYPCSITWHEGEGLVLLDIGHEPAPPGLPRGDSRDPPPVPA